MYNIFTVSQRKHLIYYVKKRRSLTRNQLPEKITITRYMPFGNAVKYATALIFCDA